MDRFWSKVDKHGPRAGRIGRCWLWTGSRNADGYGLFGLLGKTTRAHRIAWGDVPDGLHVLHRCDNPPCVRRSHLFLGTDRDNQRDKAAKGRHHNTQKEFCSQGHRFDKANTYLYHGRRMCRKCLAATSARWHRREMVA